MKKLLGKKAIAILLTSAMVAGVSSTALAGEYVVKSGDYLTKIAAEYGTTWHVIDDMNNLADPNLIYPGQILNVPDLEDEIVEEVVVEEVVEEVVVEVVVEEEIVEEEVVEEEAIIEAIGLSSLAVDDISLTDTALSPDFDPEVMEYTVDVRNDIYGLRVTPEAAEGSVITIDGVEVVSGEGYIVALDQTTEMYGVDYSVTAEILVTTDEAVETYTVTVVRENAADTYALFTENVFEDEETGITLPYELYVPTTYDETKEYPVVYVLHGAGQRLQDLDMVLKRYESATIWAKDSEAGINECIVVSPQITEEEGNGWTKFMETYDGVVEESDPYEMQDWSYAAYNLLQEIEETYSVDEDRIYATGLSMGGFGSYAIAIAHPEEFAAIVPVCGGGDPEQIAVLDGEVAIWLFHAKDDPAVSYDLYGATTIEALEAAGMEFNATVYDEGVVYYPNAHFAWTPAYANEEMRTWLFEQSK